VDTWRENRIEIQENHNKQLIFAEKIFIFRIKNYKKKKLLNLFSPHF